MGGRRGSWTGRKILIYLEIAVNSQFLPGKSKSFVKLSTKSKSVGNLPYKIEIFVKLREKNRNISEIYPQNQFF